MSDSTIRRAVREELCLGFQPARRVALDVESGATEDGRRYVWGVYDHDRACLVPEMNRAIAGYIQSVGVKVGSYKGKQTFKLKILFDCGAYGSYAIGSGLESTFSKGMLNAIASLSPAQSRGILKIVAMPGNDPSVVLPSLYSFFEGRYGWVKPVFETAKTIDDVRALYRAAIDVVPEIKFDSQQQAA